MKKYGFLAIAFVLCAFAAQPVLAQAGCCELPDQRGATSQQMGSMTTQGGQIIWIPGPIFPIPIPKGCFRTDNEAGCEKLGGIFYQLGVCDDSGKCQPTAARTVPNSLFDLSEPKINLCPSLPAPATDEAETTS